MSILARIVERTRADVAARKLRRPLAELEANTVPSVRNFEAALRAERLSLIAEFKPKSPSKGPLCSRDEVERFAKLYDGRASAMSVLCDKPHFDGGYDLLTRARQVCELPLLCKDFIVDPYQVHEAREAGADGILLMASVLEDSEIVALTAVATEMKMEPLVEVHDADELERVLRIGSRIVGVNARNLSDLSIDLGHMRELVESIPSDRIAVAESGIRSKADLDRLPAKADAVLIGSAIVSAEDPALALEGLGW